MQKNEEDESQDMKPFSESASSPEKPDMPVEAGSAGGAPVGGADAESNIEKPQPSLAEIALAPLLPGVLFVGAWACFICFVRFSY